VQILALANTTTTARAIEERLFREAFSHALTIAVELGDQSGATAWIAVDDERRIIGADWIARRVFALDDDDIEDRQELSVVFVDGEHALSTATTETACVSLTARGDDRIWRAKVRRPVISAARSRGIGVTAFAAPAGREAHGGLPPKLTQRIRDHIDAHLEQEIRLDALAEKAGLSVHHFARAFKQSVGEPPHRYIIRRRVERANELLLETELPLTEVALAVGFSDHSHLARHFRRVKGLTPKAARRAER
jgi:AraC-like DNA-binding protein